MMKKVYLFLVLIISCWGCQDMKVGYLKAENAGYLPNELEVRKHWIRRKMLLGWRMRLLG